VAVEATGAVEREIRIDARPETVFEFFTDPALLLRWKGLEADLDARPGGIYRVVVNARSTVRGEFVEVEPPSRVVFTWGFEASLGASAFGMQVLQMPAGADFYPNHDHAHDGQEEVYVVLGGSADFDIEGEQVHAEPETAIRVAPETKRQIHPGPDGVRILAIGALPGVATSRPRSPTSAGRNPRRGSSGSVLEPRARAGEP
jgi:mannose-6-phosphate isomerase-like protein (cupin superfamily)